MEKKELYNQIMESVSKEVKKALNEDSLFDLIDEIKATPSEIGRDCAKKLVESLINEDQKTIESLLKVLNNHRAIQYFQEAFTITLKNTLIRKINHEE